ncbi:venom allergen 3-like [Anthonomus grandis grandis]|uniref:venom allergen 3-like n=1 Tax=Anthonomus grandis grandis TaxID=2921223 RepID=UPI002164F4ED|nr:venom allergen 3-like [Anthonomus grandis grandis]
MLPLTLLTNILLLATLVHTKGTLDFLTKNQKNHRLKYNPKNPYCSICCVDMAKKYRGRICGIHTMCAYETKPVGAACRGLIVMEFSNVEADAIVDAHNSLRNRVALKEETYGNPGPQYPASNMRLVSWDKELAQVALRWAAQCVFDHDKCRDLDRFPVGQNIAQGTYGSKSDLEHIADWYELVDDFNKNFVKMYNGSQMEQYAPYTQLVWADTYLVGCARVAFQTSSSGRYVYNEHFVCNYGPSGNIPQQSIYKIGEACSACPEGTYCTNPEYPGLCSSQMVNHSLMRTRRPKARQLAILINDGQRLRPVEILLVYLYIFVSKDFLI